LASRNEFLNSVRNALKINKDDSLREPRQPLPAPLENVMQAIVAGELLERFEAELDTLGGIAYRASSLSMLEGILRPIVDQAPGSPVVLSRNALLSQLHVAEMVGRWSLRASSWPDSAPEQAGSAHFREDCFAAQVGITGADFALAETGSLVLTSFTEGSQLASLAPTTHVVLYRRSQLRATLDEVLQNLPVSRDPARPSPARSVVFVTGTSRTADIEQILVRGVHGPRELHAILVEEACLAG